MILLQPLLLTDTLLEFSFSSTDLVVEIYEVPGQSLVLGDLMGEVVVGLMAVGLEADALGFKVLVFVFDDVGFGLEIVKGLLCFEHAGFAELHLFEETFVVFLGHGQGVIELVVGALEVSGFLLGVL